METPSTEMPSMDTGPITASPHLSRALRGALLVVGLATVGWLVFRGGQTPTRAVYSPEGYGGYRVVPNQPAAVPPTTGSAKPPADPVAPALSAYVAGNYRSAESTAAELVRRSPGPSPEARRERSRARWVQAFTSARRGRFQEARERFALLRQESEGLRLPIPGTEGTEKDKVEAKVAEPGDATLEEEAAYQHAVLTAHLGEKSAAEAEFVRFMRQYPESPLVHAAIRRVARLHGGDIPPEVEEVWKEAKAISQERERTRQRERATCGPAVLAELLRRREGRTTPVTPDEVKELAKELGTGEQGTTLAALAKGAERRGWSARGLSLTWTGLHGERKKGGTLVALVQPGHYVIIEEVTLNSVRVWDPQFGGPDQPGLRDYTKAHWLRNWNGVTLWLGSAGGP